MKTSEKPPAGDYITPQLDAQRAERMWSVVQARSDRSRSKLHPALLVALVPAAAVLWLLWMPMAEDPLPADHASQPGTADGAGGDGAGGDGAGGDGAGGDGAGGDGAGGAAVATLKPTQAATPAVGQVLSGAAGSGRLRLPDGSELSLGSTAQVAVERLGREAVGLRVLAGEVSCAVAPRQARNFEVYAGEVVVRVKGTAFSVRMNNAWLPIKPAVGAEAADRAPQVHVAVSHGLVEVRTRRGELLANLGAGQSWSGPATPTPAATAGERYAERAERGRRGGASRPYKAVRRATPVDDVTARSAEIAADLLQQANRARIAGRSAAAAAAYAELCSRFPEDPRADLSAFELARVRLDALGDPAGALRALSLIDRVQAVGVIREDVDGLRVDALGRLGDKEACRVAQKRFLQRYPSSPHRARVEAACAQAE